MREKDIKRKKLYLFGFGDGHIPTVNKSMKDIIEDYLLHSISMQIELQGGNIEEITDELQNIIKEDKVIQQKLYNAYLSHYGINKYILLKGIMFLRIENIKKIQRDRIKKKITDILEEFEKDHDFIIKNRNEIENYFLHKVKLIIQSDYVKKVNREIKNLLSKTDDEIKEYVINKYPILVAKRLIKDALMESSPLLEKLGKAIDEGIEIHIKSQAVRAKTDTSKYEVGMMLKCIGVKSDSTEGWSANYFIKIPSRI